MSCLCSASPGFCLARGPLSSCCPGHLSLLPQEGDLKPWCFLGARQGVRGLGEAGLLRPGFQPAPEPECFGDTGANSERGAGPLPIGPCPALRVPAPSPLCLLAHSTGAPFTGHPSVAMASCAPGHSLPHGTDTLGAPWAGIPAQLPWDSPAPQQPCSGAGQVKYLPQCWPRLVLQLALLQLQC